MLINRFFNNCINVIRTERNFRLYHAAKKLEVRKNCMISLKPLTRSYKDFGHKKEKMPRLQFWSVTIVYSTLAFLVIANPIGYLNYKGWLPEDPDSNIPPV
ncbi:hypothetical protein Anas_07154 [Armadillidium nasatum]|uniref:Uncharacterized protein n=1 Tax=Armadillidium nasatum TaxID=96803 RepID=A0A5N5STT6_9CRUS|nr:hypothetical protein Anas_07154 [Armadillidium nasatum]